MSADGIRIIDNIFEQPGVDTLEGRVVPLINAARGGCHYILMRAGQYLDEHLHETESLIYTVRGRWVLCAGGERQVMETGSVFWFGDNVPTGYEVPFDEDALILIFKPGERPDHDAFIAYLEGMAARIEEEHAQGTPFWLHELPPDHPARRFATEHGTLTL